MDNFKQRLSRDSFIYKKHSGIFIIALIVLAVLCRPVDAAKITAPMSFTDDEMRSQETAFGSLMSDAVRDIVKADAAILAASVFKKAVIPSGDVSISHLTAALAFPDETIFVIELTGTQVKAAVEHAVSIYPRKNLGYLQVSGIAFEFDPKLEQSNRVVKLTINGKPVSESKKYKIATTSSLANGALGYWRIWPKENIIEKTKHSLLQALENYIASRTVIDYSNLNRISIRG